MGPRDPERPEQRPHVLGEQLERVAAGRRAGAAVAACVVAEHAEAGGERGHLRIPH